MTAGPLVRSHPGAPGWVRLVLDRPPANVLTMAACDALREAMAAAQAEPTTRLVSIEGAGAHFSYGASVEEHLPGKVRDMLPGFHRLIADLLEFPCPTAAVVRGRCLGGGFELALACDVVFASHDARLGVPEITLGVFPPAAAALLPLRVGGARAARAVLTGEIFPADWWEASGLVSGVASPTDLDAYVHHWYETFVASRSAAALRQAARACRASMREQALAALGRLEHQYLNELMLTADAVEGCTAFLEKRTPEWRHS